MRKFINLRVWASIEKEVHLVHCRTLTLDAHLTKTALGYFLAPVTSLHGFVHEGDYVNSTQRQSKIMYL